MCMCIDFIRSLPWFNTPMGADVRVFGEALIKYSKMMDEAKEPPHHRRSIRLAGYDYTSEGGYFITCVTQGRVNLFGEVVNGVMKLNDYGEIVKEEWFKTARLRPNIELDEDEFVVMPNHIHGIIWINDDIGRGTAHIRRGTACCAPTDGQF
jgi:hypothetical protein